MRPFRAISGSTPKETRQVFKTRWALSRYYGSRTWKEDFETDEAGLLPPDLRRGVLSEDGIDSVLERSEELCARMNALQQGSV